MNKPFAPKAYSFDDIMHGAIEDASAVHLSNGTVFKPNDFALSLSQNYSWNADKSTPGLTSFNFYSEASGEENVHVIINHAHVVMVESHL